MAETTISYPGDGVQTDFAVPFPYLDPSHVIVQVDKTPAEFGWVTPTTIRLAAAPVAPAVVQISRSTPADAPIVEFPADGSALSSDTLNLALEQSLFVGQEALEKASSSAERLDDIDGTAAVAASEQARVYAQQAASDRAATQAGVAAVSTKAAEVDAAKIVAVNAAASASAVATVVSAPSWTALAALTPTFVGQRATVSPADTGTHTGRSAVSPSDDVAGVVNAGVYGGYATTAGAWRRDGDISPVAMASDAQTITGAATDVATSPASVKKVLDTRFSSLRAVLVASESGYALPVVDADNRLLGGFRIDGRFQARLTETSNVPAAALDPAVLGRLPPAAFSWVATPPESGYVWALIDANRRVVLGITPEGRLKAALAPGVGVSASDLGPLVASALVDQKLWPLSAITCWGDSMTAGAGGSGTTYPGVLAGLLSSTSISNQGIGGQTSTQIAARQGGVPIKVTVSGDTIPATGGVAVTAKSVNILYNSGNYSGTSTGKLAGVAGTMSTDTSGNWTFTRAASGSAVACPPDTVFFPDTATQHEQNIVIIWSGRNNNSFTAAVRDDVIAMVDRLTPKNTRVLVLSVCNGAGETSGTTAYRNIAKVNAELARHFGDCFVDVRRYLIDFGLAEAGITATSQDTSDIAGDTVPASLRSDSVHLLGPGYTIIANLIARILRAKGWV
ncbi:phage tail fiber protein [Xanthobacter sp. YC-JY1]|uniref:phage tail fiber domain-containing protein n=1 Tax=Xanthobacter sp. YC-JY1 TaxID=2419844 RepID=UPI001EED4CA5|nr:phage tail fiber protein [Xanthobacter sp. YC-JY1]